MCPFIFITIPFSTIPPKNQNYYVYINIIGHQSTLNAFSTHNDIEFSIMGTMSCYIINPARRDCVRVQQAIRRSSRSLKKKQKVV